MTNLVTKASELIYQMDGDQLQQVVEAIQLKRQFLAKQAIRNFVRAIWYNSLQKEQVAK